MKKYALLLAFFVPFVSYASTDFISINPVTANGCGSQSIVVSGTATYSTLTSDLEIFDNSLLVSTLSQPSTYSVPVAFAEGSNQVDIKIVDAGIVLQHGSFALDVDSCPVIPAVVSSAVSGFSSRGGHRHAVAPSFFAEPTVSPEIVQQLIAIMKSLGR